MNIFQNVNALYVENESDITKVIYSTIGILFKNFYTKDNGRDGLAFFKENIGDIDIIITDINMPFMDGLKMSKEIRELDLNIPIVITSAYNDSDFLHKSIELGINGYVLKPIDMQNLFDTLKRCLEPMILQNKLKEQEEASQNELLKSAKFSAIGQLAAGITHEINTPLTYIKGNFELMGYDIEELPDDSPIKSNMLKQKERIDDGLKRIINIVSSMREMSQKSTEKKELANIYETIVVSAIMAYNRSKHITPIYINGELFSLDFNKDAYTFNANVQKQRIEQVWVIIINNALDELIKIAHFKERRLDINIFEDEQNVTVKFEDNAGGIAGEIFEHLFDAFKSTKDSSGMGVGLSIAQKIVNEQNGQIKAYNQNGGAVFEIVLKKEAKSPWKMVVFFKVFPRSKIHVKVVPKIRIAAVVERTILV